MGALLCGGGEEDAVVGDDADLVTVDGSETCNKGAAVVTLKLGELGAIDDAGYDLSDGQGLAEVGSGDAEELFGVVKWLGEGWGGTGRGWPVQVAN